LYPFSPIRLRAALMIDFLVLNRNSKEEKYKKMLYTLINLPSDIFLIKKVLNARLSKQRDIK